MSYREGRFWQPDVTVATVVVSDGRLLMVEEAVAGKRVLNQPAGHLEPDESLVEAALRETREETGLACRIVGALGEIAYVKSRKRVIGFLAEPLEPPTATVLEPGDWEIDRAEFHTADEARARLHPDQQPFVDRAIALEPEA